MKRDQIVTIAYMGLYAALYIVLKFVGNLIPILQMPNGGSIELELIPVFIASYHLGWKKGIGVAIISWLLTIILGFPMWLYWPIQIALDYVGPLAVCGLASFLWPFHDLGKAGSLACGLVLAAAAAGGIILSYGHSILVYVISAVVAAGLFAFNYWYLKEKKVFGVVIAMLLKYFLQVLSGVYYWFPEESYAGSSFAWTNSLVYNLGYNLVTMIVCMIAVPFLIDRLKHTGVKFR